MAQANLDELSALSNFITSVSGTESSTTTKTDVSAQGVEELLRQILSGPGGVKSTGASARKTGLFNSTTESDSLEDLYSRAANQVELARSATTETQETGGADLASLAISLAGTSALSSLMKGEVPFSGFFGGGGENVVAPVVEGAAEVASGATVGGGIAESGVTGAALATEQVGSQIAGTASSALSPVSSATSSALGFAGANAIPLGGAFLAGLLGGDDVAEDPLALGTGALTGFAAAGPVGAVAVPLSGLLGGLLSGSGSFSPLKGIETGLKSIGDAFGL